MGSLNVKDYSGSFISDTAFFMVGYSSSWLSAEWRVNAEPSLKSREGGQTL